MPSTAIQGQHQLFVETFPQRLLGDERAKLAHRLAVAADGEQEIDPLFAGTPAHLLQARGGALGERLAGDTRQRLAPPQSERLVDRSQLGVDRGVGLH